ncbi:MAG: chemotaxis protein CheW [Polyangiales bacterium]
MDHTTTPQTIVSEEREPPLDALESNDETYGSFWLGSSEFIVAAAHVREVVPFPSCYIGIPLTPDYVLGAFDLRGRVVPIVCMATLLGLEPPSREEGTARVAIIGCGNELIGAVFSRTGNVLRVAPQELQRVHHAPGEKNPVVSALLSLDEGARILQVLSAELIACIESVPRGDGADEYAEELEVPKERFVAVAVGDMHVALRGSSVIEIQECLEIREGSAFFQHSAGLVSLRGELLPVLRLDDALGCATGTPPDRQRLVFAQDEKVVAALMVDAVLDVFEVEESAIRTVAFLGRLPTGGICDQVVTRGPEDHLIVLEIPALFERVELDESLLENKDALARLRPQAVPETQESDELSYLVFTLGAQRFGLPISCIREIHEFPDSFLRPPGHDSRFVGMMHLRGSIVSLIDLRSRYEVEGLTPLEETKVLIVDSASSVGFLVDGLDGIVHTSAQARLEIPKLGSPEEQPSYSEHVEYVLSSDDGAVLALNPDRLFSAA